MVLETTPTTVPGGGTTTVTNAVTVAAEPISYFPELSPASGTELGRITIPVLDLDKVVMEGVDRSTLKTGPGHMPWTPVPGQPGNAVIGGHRVTNGAPFFSLDELVPGDEIVVETLTGFTRTRHARRWWFCRPTCGSRTHDQEPGSPSPPATPGSRPENDLSSWQSWSMVRTSNTLRRSRPESSRKRAPDEAVLRPTPRTRSGPGSDRGHHGSRGPDPPWLPLRLGWRNPRRRRHNRIERLPTPDIRRRRATPKGFHRDHECGRTMW